MKTKFLAYSKTRMNEVVTRWAELEKVNDKVYTYLFEKSPYCEDLDIIGVVLKINDVYFQEGTYGRDFLRHHDIGKARSDHVDNYRADIESCIRDNHHVSILTVRVYEALGWGAAPLLEHREQRRLRQETEKKEKLRARELAKEQAAEKERQRLDAVKQAFVAGEFIKKEDFILLCQRAEIKIPLRTHGTLNKSVVELSHSLGIKYLKIAQKAKPDLTGCYKLIHQYMYKISPPADKS